MNENVQCCARFSWKYFPWLKFKWNHLMEGLRPALFWPGFHHFFVACGHTVSVCSATLVQPRDGHLPFYYPNVTGQQERSCCWTPWFLSWTCKKVSGSRAWIFLGLSENETRESLDLGTLDSWCAWDSDSERIPLTKRVSCQFVFKVCAFGLLLFYLLWKEFYGRLDTDSWSWNRKPTFPHSHFPHRRSPHGPKCFSAAGPRRGFHLYRTVGPDPICLTWPA